MSEGTPAVWSPGDLWWKAPAATAHEQLCAVVDYLEQTPEETARRNEELEHARLYGNKYFRGFGPFQHARPSASKRGEERLRANVVKSVVDTATALIAGRNRPKATLLTNGGDWSQRRRAIRADRFIEGVFRDAGVTKNMPRAFRSAGIFGTGVLKLYEQHGRICAERVLPAEVHVDPVDGMYEAPRCMYQTHWVDRRVLLQLYASGSERSTLARAIREASALEDPSLGADFTTTAEPVRVVEAWHLPSGPDAGDGLHVIAIEGATLLREEWKSDRFPFVFFRWSSREVGFWGTGLVEEVKPIQLDINITLRRIKECLHLMAVPRIFVPQANNVIKSMITNEVGAIIPYTGATPPSFLTPPSVPPELFAHLRWLIGQAFEQPGVSQMAATSRKPAGLESGRAIREFNDLGADRFMSVSREYELAHMEAAEIAMDLAEGIEERTKGKKGSKSYSVVRVDKRRGGERIKWSDVRLDRESYTLQVHPTSMLPRDAAGRTETVQEWLGAGFIDATQAKRLLDFPDLDAHTDLDFAAQEAVDMRIERMLDHTPIDEAYIEPNPFIDLGYALKRTQLTIGQAEMDGAPEERLELLRQFITDCETLLGGAQGDPMAPPAAPPVPGAPPDGGGTVAALPPTTAPATQVAA